MLTRAFRYTTTRYLLADNAEYFLTFVQIITTLGRGSTEELDS